MDLFVHKTVRAEHAVENILGVIRIARAYFTLMLIHLLFCHEYKASTILLAHVQYAK